MENEKRYVVTLDLYVYSENDSEAIAKAHNLANTIANINANECSVIDIVEQPFGVIGNRKVVLTPNIIENEG